MKKNVILGLVFVVFVLSCFFGQVTAQQAYPTKPVDLIVPWSTGGATDVISRVIAKYFSQKTGIPMNVVNKAGGDGIIGLNAGYNARPDGYTLFPETHATPMLGAYHDPSEIPFDWRKRTILGITDNEVILYMVKADSPWKTLKDVAEFARNNPEKFRWGTTGRLSIGTSALGQFFRVNNLPIDILMKSQVSFKSGGATVAGVAGGHVDFVAQQGAEGWGLIEAKKVRVIAVIFEKRLPDLPDVPTVAEAGYPMIESFGWHGLAGPPGLPQNVVDFWVKFLENASKDPEFIKMVENVKKLPVYLNPKEAYDLAERQYLKYYEISKYFGWRK